MPSEIVSYVAKATGLQPLVATAVVELVGQLIAEEIIKELYDPEWPSDREYVAVENAANIARHAHVDPAV